MDEHMDYSKVVDDIFRQIKGVRFDIRFWDGRLTCYGGSGKPVFSLVFNEERAAKRLLAQGALGFGEAYMDGSLQIEGDIEAYIKLRHQFKMIKKSPHMMLAAALAMRSVPRHAENQISYHYDVGNDFFELLLDDKTMSYSAGRYEKGVKSLGSAQQKKLELVCDWLDLPKRAQILDLGSGWGGFAKYAAQDRSWRITCYTLSQTQLDYCHAMVAANNLRKQVSFVYKDMLKELPAKQYDAVVLIESIEHVGNERLADYFRQLYGVVKPGGSLYIQATGQYKQRSVDKLITKYVFPGGYLPSIGELVGYAGEAGFHIEKLEDDTPDYLQTMSTWIRNLERNQSCIEAILDEPFYRLWHLWMHGAKVAFEVGYMNLFRIKFVKPPQSHGR